jgi:hypothetical protein
MSEVNYQKNLQVPVRNNNPGKHGKVGNSSLNVLPTSLLPNIAGSRSSAGRLSKSFKENNLSAVYCAEAFFNTEITEDTANYNPDFPTGVSLSMEDTTSSNLTSLNDKPTSKMPNVTYPQEDNVLIDPTATATNTYVKEPTDNYGYTIDSPERDNRGFDGGETISNIKSRYRAN